MWWPFYLPEVRGGHSVADSCLTASCGCWDAWHLLHWTRDVLQGKNKTKQEVKIMNERCYKVSTCFQKHHGKFQTKNIQDIYKAEMHPWVPRWWCLSEQVRALLAGRCAEVFWHTPCGTCHLPVSCTMFLGTDPPLSLEGRSWLYGEMEETWEWQQAVSLFKLC